MVKCSFIGVTQLSGRLGFNPRSRQALKMVRDISLLNTQHYKVCIKGKVEQSRERSSAPLHLGVVAIEKGALWFPSTTVANFTLLYFICSIYVQNPWDQSVLPSECSWWGKIARWYNLLCQKTKSQILVFLTAKLNDYFFKSTFHIYLFYHHNILY